MLTIGSDAEVSGLLEMCPHPAFWLDANAQALHANPAGMALLADAPDELQSFFDELVEDTPTKLALASLSYLAVAKGSRIASGDARSLVTLAPQVANVETDAVARNQQLIDNSHEGFWAINPEGCTTFVNQRMADLLGYSKEEMLGRSLFDFMDEEAQQTAKANMDRRASGIAEYHDFRLRHRKGHNVWTEMSTQPIYDESGVYKEAFAIVSDSRERRRLERKITEAQRLESLSVLAGGVAHDFNNILVSILCNADMGSRQEHQDDNSKEFFDAIIEAGDKAAELSHQMLAYSGSGPMRRRAISLNATLRNCQSLLESTSHSVPMSLHTSDDDVWIRADDSRLRQILVALVANAAEACAQGGSISVSTGTFGADLNYTSSCQAGLPLLPGRYASIEVQDTGEGIEEASLPRIFDPFFSTRFVGRGLGLAAVHGLLKAHKASLHVSSKPGKGTTFRALFPIVQQSVEAEPQSSTLANESLPGTAIIVDDEAPMRETLNTLLASWGYRVVVCSSGEEFLETYDRHCAAGTEFSIAIVDLTMPGLSGLQVCEALKERSATMPILLSSGYTVDAIDDSAASFLPKPYTPKALRTAIALARKNYS